MKLIIQIPCFNEEATLETTYNDLPKHIDGIDEIEYLIINDGSTDNTVKIAKSLGIHHIVSFKQNKGLAKGFMAGLDACLHLGADIIVNTDADNQYCGEDIAKLVRPILIGEADIVIGERPIDQMKNFSGVKKRFQHFGSWVVRIASGTAVSDAASGFRAYSREAALLLNVTNEFTYTHETIIQAGHKKIAMAYVPVRVNDVNRSSRLSGSMGKYIRRSASVIIRSYLKYKPLRFFSLLGSILLLTGAGFFVFSANDSGNGHIHFIILSVVFLILGFQSILIGFLADTAASDRKILEDIQYRIREMNCREEKDDHT